jgi:hypothetical protein
MSPDRVYSVVAMAAEIAEACRVYYAADDARNWTEAHLLGLELMRLERAERDIAPTSNADAAQKLRNVANDVRIDPGPGGDRLVRSALQLAATIERGDVAPSTLLSLRALMPAALRHDAAAWNDGTTAKALMHAINWCARLRLV